MKYRLKKDTPEFEAGTVFDMIENIDVGKVLTMNAPREDTYAFEVDSVDNFDEWFEEVKQSSWEKPQAGKHYYTVRSDGGVISLEWLEDRFDEGSQAIGNVFKTEKSAHAYVDYLKAVTTVRQDEGVIDLQGICEMYETEDNKYDDFCVYTVAFDLYLRKLVVIDSDEYISANAIWFEDKECAQASLDNHPDEWKIVAGYDWSRE